MSIHSVIDAAAEKKLQIGKAGENLATRVDFSGFYNECKNIYGEGYMALTVLPAEDADAYPVALTDGIYWDVTSGDLAIKGTGYAELTYVVDDVVKKSLRWTTVVLSALIESGTAPEKWEDYITAVHRFAGEAYLSAVAAGESADEAVGSADRAETERRNAELAEQAAETARDTAVAAKNAANASASNAQTNAENAGRSADRAAESAGSAASNAEQAATSATTAVEMADAAGASATAAEEYADNAQASAGAANTSASEADASARSIKDMTVSAVQLSSDAEPTVTKTIKDGKVHLQYGIPAGKKGDEPVITADKEGTTTRIYADGVLIAQVEDGPKGDTPVITAERSGKSTIIYVDGVELAVINDGDVTAESIKTALGYTPANEAVSATKQSVSDLEAQHDRDVERLEQDIEQATPKDYEAVKRRLTNLEYAANGVLYREDISETEDYEKPLAPDVMPYGTLDKIGGKTIVMNQLIGDTYPEPFEGEVFEQTIEAKAKSVDVDSIGGKTVAWNQLVNIDLYPKYPYTSNGVTVSKSNGYLVLNGTSTDAFTMVITNPTDVVIKGHKYFRRNTKSNGLGIYGVYEIDDESIVTATGNNKYITLSAPANRTFSNTIFTPMLVDLTVLYGAGNEPDTVAEFHKSYPDSGYPYAAPQLVNCGVHDISSNGINLLDPQLCYSATKTAYLNTEYDPITNTARVFGTWTQDSNEISINVAYTKDVSIRAKGYAISFWSDTDSGIRVASTWGLRNAEEAGMAARLVGFEKGKSFDFTLHPCVSKSVPTEYHKYLHETRNIPAAVRALDGYGMAVGDVRNSIERDGDKWFYHKRVAEYAIPTDAPFFGLADVEQYLCYGAYTRLPTNLDKVGNSPNYCISNAYGKDVQRYGNIHGISAQGSNNTLVFYIDKTKLAAFGYSYDKTNAEKLEALKQYVASKNVVVQYKIEPVVTDITDLMTGFDNTIPVEQGGTLTFEHVEGFAHPIPVTETLNLSEWQQPLDTTHRYSVNGSLLTGAANTNVVGGQDYIIDLTRAGVDTPAAFPEPYYAPNPGELVSKAHEAVVSRGRNLWDEKWELGVIATATGLDVARADQIRSVNYTPVQPKTTYYIARSTATLYIFEYRSDKSYIGRVSPTGTYTSSAETAYIRLTFAKAPYDNSIILSETNVPYAPYFESTYDTAALAAKYFPDGMKSAGTVADELDIENGVAVQRVGSVDLDTLSFNSGWNGAAWYTDQVKNGKPSESSTTAAENITSSRYTPGGSPNVAHNVGYINFWMATGVTGGRLGINNGDAVNPPTGIFNYELATPVTTPIDPADLEALRTLHVEAGGSLTFTDTNAGYHLPCVNKETFLVKTGGVSA